MITEKRIERIRQRQANMRKIKFALCVLLGLVFIMMAITLAAGLA